MTILGIKIDNLFFSQALDKVEEFLEDGRSHYIVTPNPEFLVRAQKDEEFKKILNQADLALADGIGLVFASWFLGEKIKERVAGVDLVEAICQRAAEKNRPVFLFGAGPGVAEKAAENLRKKYGGLEVFALAYRLPDFDFALRKTNFFESLSPARASRKQHAHAYDSKKLFSSRKACISSQGTVFPPAILFVALGAPKQEKWIAENLKKMPDVKLAVGVGGAFDFISGRVKRAPKFMRTLGMEWLWRLIIQPWRIERIFKAVVVFPLLILREKIKNKV